MRTVCKILAAIIVLPLVAVVMAWQFLMWVLGELGLAEKQK